MKETLKGIGYILFGLGFAAAVLYTLAMQYLLIWDSMKSTFGFIKNLF